jgi:hypothetical protein
MNGWHGKQAGFRADLAIRGAGVTLQGDAYEHPVDTPSGRRSDGNLLARWSKALGDGSFRRCGCRPPDDEMGEGEYCGCRNVIFHATCGSTKRTIHS